MTTPVQSKPPIETPQNECVCPEDDELDVDIPILPNEKSEAAEQVINFENEIQNIVYVK